MRDHHSPPGLLAAYRPGKILSASIQSVARHFHMTSEGSPVLDLADALQSRPEVLIVAVVDGARRLKGSIARDDLFAQLGRPCGRDVLKRCRAADVMEVQAAMEASSELFAAAGSMLSSDEKRRPRFLALTDAGGAFRGFLSLRDLADHLSGLTCAEVEFAGKLQERIIDASSRKEGNGWEYESWSRPAKGLGGDFCLERALPGGKEFFTLCDVSGKGASASVIVSMVWGMLRTYDFSRGLSKLVREINSALIESFHMEKYLTGVFMIFDPRLRSLVVADMGHSHSLAFRGGKAYRLGAGTMNLPVGIDPGIRPRLKCYALRDGDMLAFYSDGITEQEDAEGREFGVSGITRTILRSGSLRPSLLLRERFDEHRGHLPQQDDVSFMALRVSRAIAGSGNGPDSA